MGAPSLEKEDDSGLSMGRGIYRKTRTTACGFETGSGVMMARITFVREFAGTPKCNARTQLEELLLSYTADSV